MADLTQKKVLLVEDESPLLKSLHGKLRGLGVQVLTADDGDLALQVFDREYIDLVCLDIIMPNVDGVQVLEKIRIERKNEVPIIVLTNLEEQNNKQLLEKYGIQGYFVKARTSLEELSEVVEGFLKLG